MKLEIMLKKRIKKEISGNKLVYLLLLAILVVGTFIRVYHTSVVLGFYFDQGRDANVVWDLLHNGKFFLIGPTTGIAGIFRGPFYYYLIAPVYLIASGNPVWVANFLAITTMFAIAVIYYLGYKFVNRETGLIAAAISSLSFFMMLSARWLSNPTPMFLLSALLLWSMYLVTRGKRWAWVAISFLAGTSLFHFGSSGEFFYFPAILIFLVWRWRNRPSIKLMAASIVAFGITAAPLVLFDLRHDFILFNNIKGFIFAEESFKTSFTEIVNIRFKFYKGVFVGNIFPGSRLFTANLIALISVLFVVFLPKLFKNDGVKILLLMLLSPVIGLLFFQGNQGNIYGYYLTGYFLIFILLFSAVLGYAWRYKLGKLLVVFFFYVFITSNWPIVWSKITDNADGPSTILLGSQLPSIEWVYQDAAGKKFNTDVYVPPVIPHAYDYLFRWYSTTPKMQATGSELIEEHVDLLYTLYEEDPPHPERLEAWLERQEGIGEVVAQEKFGGITVQRRTRI